ncbi:hypothetical protein [uncultured Bacteroides sp.]|uniref:hypothetical protein n=1 Tax=uncultured Bacteroides sp. TaxID=162156 RepID=UPI0025E5CC6D|nr:hypothetical protein [uncultured Bacteroides sp.]
MKGDIRMNILKDILEKESGNRDAIYLYCLENSWRAFGRSAFYLSLLYPGMEVLRNDNQDIICLYICISDDYLMEIFEMNRIYVGNEYIEIKVPDRICAGEDEYIKWCNEWSDIVKYE